MASEGNQAGASILQRPLRLWLVRHGLTRLNEEKRYCGHSDPPLSPRGYAQARWLAERLHTIGLTKIYCSDTQRARSTAEMICEVVPGTMVRSMEEWRELNFGAWEGLTYEEIRERFPQEPGFFQDPLTIAPPEGESFPQLLKRIDAGWRVILKDVDNQGADGNSEQVQYALVSHGGPLRALLCRLLGWSMEQQWQLRLDPGSLSAIDIFPGIGAGDPPYAMLVLLNEQCMTIQQSV